MIRPLITSQAPTEPSPPAAPISSSDQDRIASPAADESDPTKENPMPPESPITPAGLRDSDTTLLPTLDESDPTKKGLSRSPSGL
jgi:hypothetical protein